MCISVPAVLAGFNRKNQISANINLTCVSRKVSPILVFKGFLLNDIEEFEHLLISKILAVGARITCPMILRICLPCLHIFYQGESSNLDSVCYI